MPTVPRSGTLIDIDPEASLDEADDLVLTVADRRDRSPDAVAEELAAIDRRFDVDTVYLAPE